MRRTVTCVGALALALGGAAAGKASKAISANPSSASTESTYNIPNDITMMRCDPPLTEIDPDAVCNDGTPAYYYFAEGKDPTQWVLYLQGGDWCYSGADCQSRWNAGAQERMSSNGIPNLTPKDGILGTTNQNPWGNANKVYLRTCSSDAFVGDTPASSATGGYAMRGARQVMATVQALITRRGLGATEGHTLLLSGCSSGSVGVMHNLDAVAAMLPDTVTLKGLIDGAAWVDIAPLTADAQVSIQTMTQGLMAIAHPNIPPQCAQAYPGEEWKCIFGQYRLPFVQTPYFLAQGQFDTFEMLEGLDSHLPKVNNPGTIPWADQLQADTLQLFKTLNPAIATIFSTTCEIHCVTIDDNNFYLFSVDGETVAQAMGKWAMGQGKDIISNCQGFNCTSNCGGSPWSPSNIQGLPS